jgi:hypothetical protein
VGNSVGNRFASHSVASCPSLLSDVSIKCNCLWATKAKIFEAAARPVGNLPQQRRGFRRSSRSTASSTQKPTFNQRVVGSIPTALTKQNQTLTLPPQINRVTRTVVGMVLHPAAVTFACVTYLPAIGRDRLTHPNGPRQVLRLIGSSTCLEKGCLGDAQGPPSRRYAASISGSILIGLRRASRLRF